MKRKEENKNQRPRKKSKNLKVNKQTLKDLDSPEKVKGGARVTGGMPALRDVQVFGHVFVWLLLKNILGSN